MRFNLEALEGKRVTFTAIFWKYGSFRSKWGAGRTILLRFVRDMKGNLLTDHTWINYTPSFDAAGEFRQGDLVCFDARVGKYIKGYFGQRIEDRLSHPPKEDYRLKFPHNVRIIGSRDMISSLTAPVSGSGCASDAPGEMCHVPQ